MRDSLFLSMAFTVLTVVAAPTQADPLTPGALTRASGPSPFPPHCGGSGEASETSISYQNAEVETHLAVNPANPNNVVAFWQQDRWSDGGSHGNVAAYSTHGGIKWTARVAPTLS